MATKELHFAGMIYRSPPPEWEYSDLDKHEMGQYFGQYKDIVRNVYLSWATKESGEELGLELRIQFVESFLLNTVGIATVVQHVFDGTHKWIKDRPLWGVGTTEFLKSGSPDVFEMYTSVAQCLYSGNETGHH